MPWKCTDSVITAYPQFIWPFDGINDLCWATISYQMTRARRLSGLRLGSLTMARGPAWSAPTPPITRQTCSNTWRRDMYRLKAIIARFVRSFVQIPSLWKTTNPGVPTKVRGLLFDALSRSNHRMLMPLLALICCISATIAQSLQDREFADNLIRSKLEMNSVSRLWFCKECPYSHARHDVMKKHVDAQHLAIQYSCSICLKLSPTQHALKQHQSSQHK